jgi:ferredoxin-NADP reductase
MTLQILAIIIGAAVVVQFAALGTYAIVQHGRLRRQSQGGWQGLREFRVDRREIENEDGDVCSFHLVPVDGRPLPGFAPGQFLTFRLQVEDPETRETKTVVRCYSLSNRFDQGHYRVSIKRVSPDGLSSGYFHRQVKVGDVLAVKAPAGHFQLDLAANGPVVLIGGGIGITPLLSMIGASLAATPQREIWLFYGVRNGGDHAMKGELANLARAHRNFHLNVCYSRPRASDIIGTDYQHASRVDIDLLRRTLDGNRFGFYLCGPRAMLASLVPALREWGVAEADIHYEAFGPASLARPGGAPAVPAQPLAITFARSQRTIVWEGRESSLLELAENHGIRVDSGCRGGSCGTCRTRLESGEVAYDHPPEAEPEAGTCLLCVATPKTDLVLDA